VIVKSAEFITSAPDLKRCPPAQWPEVAFAGRSNVGKSSLINCLLNRKGLVRTSSTPGRTQLLNFFAINELFYFVDLPGYGFANAPKSVRKSWQPMIHGYLSGRKPLHAVVWLLDVRRDPTAEDLLFLDWLEEFGLATIPVVTKIDKVSRNELGKRLAIIAAKTGLDPEHFSTFSTLKGIGREDVWERIEDVLSESSVEGLPASD